MDNLKTEIEAHNSAADAGDKQGMWIAFGSLIGLRSSAYMLSFTNPNTASFQEQYDAAVKAVETATYYTPSSHQSVKAA